METLNALLPLISEGTLELVVVVVVVVGVVTNCALINSQKQQRDNHKKETLAMAIHNIRHSTLIHLHPTPD